MSRRLDGGDPGAQVAAPPAPERGISVVAIGDARRLAGYALAGARLLAVEEWEALDGDAALLVLTPEAYDALEDELDDRPGLVWAVLP